MFESKGSESDTIKIPNEGITACFPLIIMLRHAKRNTDGRIQYTGAIRNRNHLVCVLSHLAFYLFHQFHIENKALPDFTSRKDWYNIYLLRGENREQPISYGSLNKQEKDAFKQCGIVSSKITHTGYSMEAREAELKGVSYSQIQRAGLWNNEEVSKCYLTNIPLEFIRALAWFEPSKRQGETGSYYLPCTLITPPLDLCRAIFPGIEGWLVKLRDACTGKSTKV